MKPFAEIMFTPAVVRLQAANGSRAARARMQADDALGPGEIALVANADSFYMATVSESGWPYVQHRGGPRGFLKVISPATIAFADFGGNRQYVSAGNASHDDRVSMILMDYPNRRRLKLLGRLRFQDIAAADPRLVSAVDLPDYRARIERVAVIDVEAFDWNCPQHITRRFTLEEIESASKPLHLRIGQLEAELAEARSQLNAQP